MSRVFAQESFQNEHMRDLLEEVEDQLSNSLKELYFVGYKPIKMVV